jgi:hypothetical protein
MTPNEIEAMFEYVKAHIRLHTTYDNGEGTRDFLIHRQFRIIDTLHEQLRNSIPKPTVECGHSEHDCFVKINGSTVYAGPNDLALCVGLALNIRATLGLEVKP